ncbi:MAG: LysR family transcriptional regulator [Hyphomicrobiales bacterium]|nr:LysR family transcriptional regulator [Hyphomicrobiales bacterium]
MEELRAIFHFVQVARSRSFRKAAAELRMPPSTLSRSIVELEKSLTTRLFNRTTRRVELTEAGQRYFARCEMIIEETKSAREDLHAFALNPRGIVRVTMSPDFGATFLARPIAEFSEAYPDISLQLDLSPRRVDLIGENIDIAIRIGAPSEPYLVARRLMLAPQALFAAPNFVEKFGEPQSPAQLTGFKCLNIARSDQRNAWVLRRENRLEEVAVFGPITTNNPRMLLKLAAEGAGIVAADAEMAAPYVRSGALRRVLADWEPSPVPIYTVMPSRTPPLRVRLFVDHLHARLKSNDSNGAA